MYILAVFLPISTMFSMVDRVSSHYILQMMDPNMGFLSMSEAKKSRPAGVGGKNNKKGKLGDFK